MPLNKSKNLFDKGSFLASLLFLKQEALRDGYADTERAVRDTIEIFLAELEKNHEMDGDLLVVRDFLLKAMALKTADLTMFINLINSLDHEMHTAPLN